MKITIDTKEDTHEEIKKVIDILTSMVGSLPSNQDSESEPVVGEGIFGMFSDNKAEEESEKPETPSASEVAGMFSENREEQVNVPEPDVVDDVKKDDDEPSVVPY